MLTLLLIFLLTICAAFIQRVSGFGFGIFVMMFFPYFLPSYGQATMLSGLLAGSTAIIIVAKYWKQIQWRLMIPLLTVNIVASYIAIEYMASLSNNAVKRYFGIMFVLIALFFLFCDKKVHVPQNRATKGIIGMLSGIMGGMFAMPGPPLVLYYINIIKEKTAYVATIQAFSVILNIFYTLFRAQVGFLGDDIPLWWCAGIAGALIGTSIGTRFFERISSNALRKIVYIFLMISGMSAIIF